MTFRVERNGLYKTPEKLQRNPQIDNSFDGILKEKIAGKNGVKLSTHAEKRLEERQINLQKADMDKLTNAMDKLEEKGARESLMIYKDMALIASIKNRTIITAMESENLDIVTNIDSTMIVK